MDNPDVIFIGAGPVGLYTAIQARLHNPALQIKMFERSDSYTRSHMLKINRRSYRGAHQDERLQSILQTLHGSVRTTEIEARFRELAIQLGIDIEYGKKIDDVKQLAHDYPTAKTIVGSDGARSGVRQQVFNDRKSVDKTMQTIIEVKYDVTGDAPRLTNYQYLEGLTQIPHFVTENIGRNRDGKTPVSLFFFADRQTGDEIRELGTPRAPAGLPHIKAGSRRMTSLANSIHPWLALRASYGEKRVSGSEKIAAVDLNVYKSEHFTHLDNGVRYVLIGDAAMGVPYFRALNAGLTGGNMAARLIADQGVGNQHNNADFEQEMNNLARQEMQGAFWKNQAVKVGRFSRFFVGNSSRASSAATMPTKQIEAMQQARVTPISFYRRHSRKFLALAIFAGVSAILIGTGGLGALSIIGAIAAGGLTALAAVVAYKTVTSIIRYSRNIKNRLAQEPIAEPFDPGSDLSAGEEEKLTASGQTGYGTLRDFDSDDTSDDEPDIFPALPGTPSLSWQRRPSVSSTVQDQSQSPTP
ncbi:FAD-dependent oxidoreductase [Legionella sp. CNM-4043-24]|uniref:FAD-dependent oxidoreductase n=1 Tax=Legionella sp. CNM-4043-24 TaxID=3421646 RepID=UPI00403B2EB6